MSSKDDQEGQTKAAIRVVDRRRFDSDGEEKSDSPNKLSPEQPTKDQVNIAEIKTTSQQAESPNSASATFDGQTTQTTSGRVLNASSDANTSEELEEVDTDEQSGISFGSFLLSLATQALMQLGQLKAPDGMPIPVDPDSAHQTIEILSMLQEKTKGNLDIKEEGLLRDTLHSLRLAFLRFR